MSPPILPLDVVASVAEFLAGDLAFGTIAALNQANNDTRAGTLPVLYETLLFDKVDETREYQDTENGNRLRDTLPGFRFTKFLFCQDIHSMTAPKTVTFPNLVAIIDDLTGITRNLKGRKQVHVAGFALSLFKPVRSATLFGLITGTPVYCFPRRRSDSNPDPWDLIPTLRPLQELRSVHREKAYGAGLICDDANTHSWTTGISLRNVEFLPTIHGQNDDERDVNTLYELMKIAGRARSRDLEAKTRGNYHILVNIMEHDCPTFVQRFQREVSARPEILLNRIRLAVLVDTGVEACGDVIQQTVTEILDLYTKHATSSDKLPTHREELLMMKIVSSPDDLPPLVSSKSAQARWIAASSGNTPLPYIIRDRDVVVHGTRPTMGR